MYGLVDIDDAKGLAAAIEWVLSLDDDDWRRLSANAYETAATGSWQKSARTFEKGAITCMRQSKS
jgi:hypothetical protein